MNSVQLGDRESIVSQAVEKLMSLTDQQLDSSPIAESLKEIETDQILKVAQQVFGFLAPGMVPTGVAQVVKNYCFLSSSPDLKNSHVCFEIMKNSIPLVIGKVHGGTVQKIYDTVGTIPPEAQKTVIAQSVRLFTEPMNMAQRLSIVSVLKDISPAKIEKFVTQVLRFNIKDRSAEEIVQIIQFLANIKGPIKLSQMIDQLMLLVPPNLPLDQILNFLNVIFATKIFEVVGTIPLEAQETVLAQSFRLFTESMTIDQRLSIVSILKNISPDKIEKFVTQVLRFDINGMNAEEIVLLIRFLANIQIIQLLANKESPIELSQMLDELIPLITSDFSLYQILDLLNEISTSRFFLVSEWDLKNNPVNVFLRLSKRCGQGIKGMPPQIIFGRGVTTDAGGGTRVFFNTFMEALKSSKLSPMRLLNEQYIPVIRPESQLKVEDQIAFHKMMGRVFHLALQGVLTTGHRFPPFVFELMFSLSTIELNDISPDGSHIPDSVTNKFWPIYAKQFLKLDEKVINEIWSQDQLPNEIAEWSFCNKQEFLKEFKEVTQAIAVQVKCMHECSIANGAKWEELKGSSPQELERKIQGVFSREAVMSALSFNNPHSVTAMSFRKWIEQAPLQMLQRFVLAVTGSENLVQGSTIQVEIDDESKNRLPTYQTCSKRIKLSHVYGDEKNEQRDEIFSKKIEESLEYCFFQLFQLEV